MAYTSLTNYPHPLNYCREFIMQRPLTSFFCAAALAIVLPLAMFAADDTKTYTNPEEAGIAYKLQGEYSGQVKADGEQVKYGVQVIALGDDKYRAVTFAGGLPGDGWDRSAEQMSVEAKADGDSVTFSGDGYSGKVDGEKLVISADNGDEIGTLEKVHRKSETLGKKAPEGAKVLFDGKNADHWENGKIVENNLLLADTFSKLKANDFKLHVEFRTPFKPDARGQARGNSGVYVQSRYEVQVLDSFGLEGKDNECGGIYQVAQPKVNMCFPPLSWQTYDIDFTAAKYDDQGKKTENARVTVKHNGVVIHDNLELPKQTPGRMQEAPEAAPVAYLQGHGNPVVFRNIWVVEK